MCDLEVFMMMMVLKLVVAFIRSTSRSKLFAVDFYDMFDVIVGILMVDLLGIDSVMVDRYYILFLLSWFSL